MDKCLVKETAKKLAKTEYWVVKWSSRNEGFKDMTRRGRPKVLNKEAKIVLKKATTVTRPSLEQVHGKRRLDAPERAKKPLLSPPSNDQLFSNL